MQKSTDVQKYEVMLLIAPNIGDEAVTEEIAKVKKLIEGSDGAIYHEDFWGIQILAYRIKGNTKGFFSILNLTLAPEKLAEIERTLQLEKNILRFLLVKTPQSYVPKKYEFTLPVRRIGRKKLKEEEKKIGPVLEPRDRQILEPKMETMFRTEVKPLHTVEKPDKTVKHGETVKQGDIMVKADEELKSDDTVKSCEVIKKPDETVKPSEVLKPSEKKKTVTQDLDSIDKKLKSIIDNPDISL